MKKYISNPQLGEIDFSKDFVFDFSTIVNENPSLDDTDFQLTFSVENTNKFNSFSLTNVLGNPYRSKDSKEFTLKNAISDCEYLSDSLIFVNGKPYKKLTFENEKDIHNYYVKDGITYVLTDKYEVYSQDKKYIKRINDKNERGEYVRPVKVSLNTNDFNEISFLADQENLFDTNHSRSFRIVVNNKGKNITLWDCSNNNLKKIKTFQFSNSIDKGKVKLSIDNNMNLCDLSFSFFEA